jgi:serine/threonine protein phosphatase PrpC
MVFDRLNDETSLFKGARRLCHEAYKRGSTDNISVVVIDLRSLEWARFSRRNEDDVSDEGQ